MRYLSLDSLRSIEICTYLKITRDIIVDDNVMYTITVSISIITMQLF